MTGPPGLSGTGKITWYAGIDSLVSPSVSKIWSMGKGIQSISYSTNKFCQFQYTGIRKLNIAAHKKHYVTRRKGSVATRNDDGNNNAFIKWYNS